MKVNETRRKLGIIAGKGDLPVRLIEACRKQGRPYFVVALKGHAEPSLIQGDVHHIWARLGNATSILAQLKAAQVQDIVMAGSVRRPSWSELRPDLHTTLFLLRHGLFALGDDGLLRAVAKRLEDKGFRVVGAHNILHPLLVLAGPLGRFEPEKSDWQDIGRGLEVAKALGRADVGQAVVIQQGIVLAVEAIEGTDALIQRAGLLQRTGKGAILVKACKPQQDQRVDLPTIGVKTVENCAAAGLRGIAIQAGKALVIDRDIVAATADRLGLFVIGVETSND